MTTPTLVIEDAKALLRQIKAVRQFASDDPTLHTLSSARVTRVNGNQLCFAASDGHSLIFLTPSRDVAVFGVVPEEAGELSDGVKLSWVLTADSLDEIEFRLKKAPQKLDAFPLPLTAQEMPNFEAVSKKPEGQFTQFGFDAKLLGRLEAVQKACGAAKVKLESAIETEPSRWIVQSHDGEALVLIMGMRI